MAGKKGYSGRKTKFHEDTRASVIMKSWEVLKRFFDDETISIYKRAEIASRICTKDIPERRDSSDDILINNQIVLISPTVDEQKEFQRFYQSSNN